MLIFLFFLFKDLWEHITFNCSRGERAGNGTRRMQMGWSNLQCVVICLNDFQIETDWEGFYLFRWVNKSFCRTFTVWNVGKTALRRWDRQRAGQTSMNFCNNTRDRYHLSDNIKVSLPKVVLQHIKSSWILFSHATFVKWDTLC